MFEAKRHPKFEISTGFECTALPPELGKPMVGNLELSGHFENFEQDLRMLKELGITTFRAPVPWYLIERQYRNPPIYDWEWMDRYIALCDELGLTIIADTCHHSSAPSWTSFANRDFPYVFARFTDAFSRRYPQVKYYNLINEPTATAAICTNHWHPKNPNYFLMLKHMGMANNLAAKKLFANNPEARLYFTDPLEHKQAMDSESQAIAAKFNEEERFLTIDLWSGLINKDHPLYKFLKSKGFSDGELAWFVAHPMRNVDLAMDYYLHVEKGVEKGQTVDGTLPARGMTRLLIDYVERYAERFPDMRFGIGEVNVRGTVYERITWLKYVLSEGELLGRILGDRFLDIAWYPAIDSYCWGNGSLMTALTGNPEKDLDPTGLVYINPHTLERFLSELTELVKAYNYGAITARDLPAYRFGQDMHNNPIERLGHRFKRWKWQDQPA